MLIAMTLVSALIAVAAADVVWRSRHEADLRRRWRSRAASTVAPVVTGQLIALAQQPEDPENLIPRSPLSDGDVIVFVSFIVIVALVFGFDMARTWWETTRWRREARRRRREIR